MHLLANQLPRLCIAREWRIHFGLFQGLTHKRNNLLLKGDQRVVLCCFDPFLDFPETVTTTKVTLLSSLIVTKYWIFINIIAKLCRVPKIILLFSFNTTVCIMKYGLCGNIALFCLLITTKTDLPYPVMCSPSPSRSWIYHDAGA